MYPLPPATKQADSFDPQALRLAGVDPESLAKRPSKRLPRHRPGEPFLKGPIPWYWLAIAARLPGKAVQVSLLLWKEAGCRKCRVVPFCLAQGADIGVSRKSARMALRRLQSAGLVSLEYLPGKAVRATLLDLLKDG
jgi:hypothetical protein